MRKVVLGVLVVCVCLAGLYSLFSLGLVKEFPSGFGTIGEVNVTFMTQATINLTYSNLDFGSGYLTSGASEAYLNSYDGETTGWTAVEGYTPGGIIIENVGTVDVNLTFSLSSNTSDFIGGTDPQMYYMGENNESNTCDATTGRLVTDWPALLGADWNSSICENMSFTQSSNAIDFHVNLTIPDDTQGLKNVTITFEASVPE